MWQMRKIDLVLSLIAFVFLIPKFGMSQNQTLRINIELPAGVGLSSGSSSLPGSETSASNEAGPPLYGETVKNFSLIAEDGSYIDLIWIKLQTYENSQFLLDYNQQGETGKPTVFYFLNDNTNNLPGAQALKEFPALLNFNQKGLLIRNIEPRRITLSSWLGFHQGNQLGTLLLEYF
jgi:hypothetical protein